MAACIATHAPPPAPPAPGHTTPRSRAAKQLWLELVRVLLLGEAETLPLLGSES